MSSTGETISVLGDEPDHLVEGRSSSFAKKMLAALRISFAFRNSETSFCSRLISAAASVVTPGLHPRVDLVAALPQSQRLRAHPEQPGHMPDSAHYRRVRRPRLREHPQRPLTHLRRILPVHRVPSLLKERNESQADSLLEVRHICLVGEPSSPLSQLALRFSELGSRRASLGEPALGRLLNLYTDRGDERR